MTELPEGWTSARLDEIADVRLGRQRSPKNHWGTRMRPYLRAANVTWSGLDLTDVKEMNFTEAESEVYELRNGDVLVAEASGSASEVGKPAVWKDEIADCCFQNTLIRVRPRDGVVSEFLRYFLLSEAKSGRIGAAAPGVGIHHIGSARLGAWAVPLPPPEEQMRIVAALEEQFSRLDAGEAQLERIVKRILQWRRTLVIAGLTGQLTEVDPKDEPADVALARATAARGTRRRLGTQTPPLMDLVDRVPAHWVWSTVEDVATRVTVGHVGPMKHEYVPEGIAFLRSQNVRENTFATEGLRYISPEFHERLRKSRIVGGDVVIVRSGTVGVSCVVPDWLGEANCADLVIVQRPVAVDPHFLAYYINAMTRGYVASETVGVALAHFNTRSVAQLPIPVPPLQEQERIVAVLQQRLSVVEIVTASVLQASRRSTQLRSSVLAAAFRGSLVPQDPTDPPATRLLDRIRTERAAATPVRRRPRVKA